MFVHRWFALALTLFTACSSCASPKVPWPTLPSPGKSEPSFEDRVGYALDATVKVTRTDGHMVCAGTRVAYDKVLTAYHCLIAAVLDQQTLELVVAIDPTLTHVEIEGIRDMPLGIITRSGDSMLGSHALKWDMRHDLALVSTPPSFDPVATITASELRAGQRVFAVGHPLGIEYAVTAGIVSDPGREDGDSLWTMVDLVTHGGNSGGGLWNERGQLVGVCSAGYHHPRTGEALGLNLFAVPWALAALMAG